MTLRPVRAAWRALVFLSFVVGQLVPVGASQLMLDDVKVEPVPYGALGTAYRLVNSVAELIVAPAAGGRIISYHLHGAGNALWNNEARSGGRSGAHPGYPDLQPGGFRMRAVSVFTSGDQSGSEARTAAWQIRSLDHNEIRLLGPLEKGANAQLILELKLYPHSSRVRLRERIRNLSAHPLRLAIEGAALMPPGGIVTVPRNPHSRFPSGVRVTPDSGLKEAPVWVFSGTTISVRTDADIGGLGADSIAGWVSCQRAGQVFVRTFAYHPSAHYPANGCTVRLRSHEQAMEITLLSPVFDLSPHGAAMFVEEWSLQRMLRKVGR